MRYRDRTCLNRSKVTVARALDALHLAAASSNELVLAPAMDLAAAGHLLAVAPARLRCILQV